MQHGKKQFIIKINSIYVTKEEVRHYWALFMILFVANSLPLPRASKVAWCQRKTNTLCAWQQRHNGHYFVCSCKKWAVIMFVQHISRISHFSCAGQLPGRALNALDVWAWRPADNKSISFDISGPPRAQLPQISLYSRAEKWFVGKYIIYVYARLVLWNSSTLPARNNVCFEWPLRRSMRIIYAACVQNMPMCLFLLHNYK